MNHNPLLNMLIKHQYNICGGILDTYILVYHFIIVCIAVYGASFAMYCVYSETSAIVFSIDGFSVSVVLQIDKSIPFPPIVIF